MTLKAFAVTLANSLISRGIDKETAVSTVLRITRSITEEDKAEIGAYQSADDFSELSDALVRLIEDEKRAAIIENATAETLASSDAVTGSYRTSPHINTVGSTSFGDTRPMQAVRTGSFDISAMGDTKKIDAVKGSAPEAQPSGDTRVIDAVRTEESAETAAPMGETKQMDAVKNTAAQPELEQTIRADAIPARRAEKPSAETRKINTVKKETPARRPGEEAPTRQTERVRSEGASHYTEYQKSKLTSRGAKFFWTFFVLTLPIIALAAVAFFGIFALCVLSVCALIAALFVLLSAVVIAGSLVAIVSLIYGAVMIFTGTPGIGIYEIGVGVVTSGVAILVSVALYLAATRAMPYLLRLLVAFTGHTLSQIPTLWDRAREECNKL